MIIIGKIRRVLARDKRILFAYVYGSFVKNKKYARDIDIAVFVKGKVSSYFERKLAMKISKKIGKEVEVRVLK
ncbi:MAG TPA: nucleotidyltransferase domain-containing protein [Candidatus Aenigmarchaeota archaeon]|nr:nucleotidyltransferase domain-containing protein [Candidatus Aenigmarchaeota archaeon]